ncbi:hypothetical protein B0T25DRAFT_207929 [Lasiosphaeria hispida]|uniref:Rhodopsin domain-containing protein n=1 Tax=Lasiosphaeria hispida TaxID=260671 RepID=A0AAJ0HIF5_9PEZI|nr:hypothetical protein B0T25DRAFT_207929 [Lasiosphaeria hispida]
MSESSSDPGGQTPTGGEPGVFPGQSAPLAVLTTTDQSGVIIIGATLALIFAVISMLIRLYVRLEFRHSFARDDLASVGSLALFIIQSSLVFTQVSQGLGKTFEDVTPEGLVALQKDGFAADVFYLLTLWLTKTSIVYLFIRLSPDRNHIRAAYVCLAAATLFLVVSVFTTCLRCNLAAPWIFIGEQCPGLLARWQATAAFDMATEVGLFAVAVYMTQGLQLDRSKKFVVLFAFGLRLLVIIPTLIRLIYLSTAFSSADPTLDSVLATICTQTQLSYAIIATTTPCLRPFMSALNTHYGGPTETKTPQGSKMSRTGGGYHKSAKSSKLSSQITKASQKSKSDKEYTLNDLSSQTDHKRDRADSESRGTQTAVGSDSDPEMGAAHGKGIAMTTPATRWDRADYRVAVVSRNLSGDARSTQSNDSQSMIISKNTEWQVEYQGDDTGRSQASRHS